MAVHNLFKGPQTSNSKSRAGSAAKAGSQPSKQTSKSNRKAGSKAAPGRSSSKAGRQEPAEGASSGPLTAAAKLVAEIVASPLFYLVGGLAAIKLVSSFGETSASILVFASAPIVLLTALSKSSLGQQVQESLNEKLPELEAEAQVLRQQHEAARQSSQW